MIDGWLHRLGVGVPPPLSPPWVSLSNTVPSEYQEGDWLALLIMYLLNIKKEAVKHNFQKVISVRK